jgi:hypothetical protein
MPNQPKALHDPSMNPDIRPITSQTQTLFDILFPEPGKDDLFWQEVGVAYF